MKQNKSKSQRNLAIEAWTGKLVSVLAEADGNHPVIRRIEYDPNEGLTGMLWWRSSGDQPVCIGVSAQDAKLLLPSLSDILNRTWGSGDMTDQGPADTEEWDVRNVQFATGENVRFFVASAVTPAPVDSNLEMLMDIELPIVIRFGRTQMALRDLAGLTPGSVIGFDRGVDEPVELLVNGHVLALGEAVTVKGSYGIRISRVSSRQERLVTSGFAAKEQTI
jgi:flagellar motor switch protein FliN